MLTNFRVLLHNMLWGLPRKFRNKFHTSVKMNTTYRKFFSVSNFYIPLGTTEPRNNKFPRAWAEVVKTAWYGNVSHKQRAATEFLVAAKQLVTNILKRLNICAATVSLITPVSCWASWIAGSKEDRMELGDARSSGRPTADERVMLADIMPHGQGSNSEQHTKTLKTLQKRFTEVRPHKNVADILLQNGHTQVPKNRKQSEKSKGQFFPIHHTAQVLLVQISLETSNMPCVVRGLRVMTRLLKKCSSGCEYKIKTGTVRYMLVSRCRKTVEVYGD